MDTALLHPTYFPSIAQMAVMAQAGQLVFEVCDNYQKQTYRNRCYVAHAHGKLSLNVPIRHSKDGTRQRTINLQPENDFPWIDQHWKSLQSAYRTSPYFEYYEDELQPLFLEEVNNLLLHESDLLFRVTILHYHLPATMVLRYTNHRSHYSLSRHF